MNKIQETYEAKMRTDCTVDDCDEGDGARRAAALARVAVLRYSRESRAMRLSRDKRACIFVPMWRCAGRDSCVELR